MSISTGATDIVGGAGYGYGGFGGIAPIGLIGLNTFLGGNGFGNGFLGNGVAGGAIPGTTVAEQNISELRKDVAGVNTTVEALGNEIAAAHFQQTMDSNNNFRNLDNRLCDNEKATMNMGFALSNQMNNFQHAVDNQFCAVKQQINADGDATRALITQNLIDGLRAELALERRGRDNREIEINVQNNATQTQNQLQAQLQAQSQMFANGLNLLGDQVNRATNSVVNLGTMVGSGQTATQSNTKVNS